MFKWLARLWTVNDHVLPPKVDLIALISYAATSDRLTNGSQKTLELARELSAQYPTAAIAWCSSSKNNKVEEENKRPVLSGIYAGLATSSTDECEAILRAATATGRQIRMIIVVAEGAHSRRCKRVWKHMSPNAEICFRSVLAWEAADKESPSWPQSHWQVWLLLNIVLYPFYRWWPRVAWFAKRNFHQPGY